MTTYIAGPMAGLPDKNYPAFQKVAQELRDQGRTVLSPHEIDGGSMDTRPYEWYLREALKLLLQCDDIVLLPDWENSRGATIEWEIANALKMPCHER